MCALLFALPFDPLSSSHEYSRRYLFRDVVLVRIFTIGQSNQGTLAQGAESCHLHRFRSTLSLSCFFSLSFQKKTQAKFAIIYYYWCWRRRRNLDKLWYTRLSRAKRRLDVKKPRQACYCRSGSMIYRAVGFLPLFPFFFFKKSRISNKDCT